MPVSVPVSPDPAGARSEHSDPWAELRRYEQAKADGTAPEASFDDLLDVINPLQHIPIVSTIYREITGDTIQGAARIVGGGLYGGVGGFVGGLVNAVAEEATGRDLAGHAMVAVGLREDTPADATTPADTVQVAEAERAATPAPAAEIAGTQTPAPADAPAAAQTTAQTSAQAAPAAAEPRPAGEDAALAAGGGALTGLAALKAFARDTGQAAAAAQADRTAAARTQTERTAAEQAAAESAAAGRSAGELQANQQANAALDRTPAAAATAPTQFMALGDRGALINHRVRTNPAALAAESDRLGHRRLQGDPRTVPTPATAGRSAAVPSAPAAEPTAAPAATAPHAIGTAPGAAPGAAAARGDLAERMMRALNKYEAMHRDP